MFSSIVFFLPWIVVSLIPVLVPIFIMSAVAATFLNHFSNRMSRLLRIMKKAQTLKLKFLMSKFIYQAHLAEGVNIQVIEKENGEIKMFVRMISKGILWGFTIKARSYHEAVVKIKAKLNHFCEKEKLHTLSINRLMKIQQNISQNFLFASHDTCSENIVLGLNVFAR